MVIECGGDWLWRYAAAEIPIERRVVVICGMYVDGDWELVAG